MAVSKATQRKFAGVYPAMVTPLNKNLGIDENGLRYEVDYLIKNGVQGLVAMGSSGEYPYLTLSEKKKVIDIVVEQTKRRVPVIVCPSAMGTDEVIMLSRYAQRRGADGLMITLPIYFSLTDKDVFNHYKLIAKAVDLPILLYDFPFATHFDFSFELISRLSRIENIVGIKETGSAEKVLRMSVPSQNGNWSCHVSFQKAVKSRAAFVSMNLARHFALTISVTSTSAGANHGGNFFG